MAINYGIGSRAGNIFSKGEGGTEKAPMGGNGSFNDKQDSMDMISFSMPNLPTWTTVNGYNLYSMSPDTFNVFIHQVSNHNFNDTIKNSWLGTLNPINCITSINWAPFNPPLSYQKTLNIQLGPENIYLLGASDGAGWVSQRYSRLDFGVVSVDEYYGNFLDYEYTQINIHLPFIGMCPLDVSKCMGKELRCEAIVDMYTGAITYYITSIDNPSMFDNHTYMVGEYSGNCFTSIEFGSVDYTAKVASLMQSASAATTSTISGVIMGNPIATATSLLNSIQGITNSLLSTPKLVSAGTIGSGSPSILQVFIQINRPKWVMPTNYAKLYGLPTNYESSIKECKGFNVIKQVLAKGSETSTNPYNPTLEEYDELINILQNGFYLNKQRPIFS